MSGGIGFCFRGPEDQTELLNFIAEQYEKHGVVDVTAKPRKKGYSEKQRGALHLVIDQLTNSLNDAGLDQVLVLRPGTKIKWTPEALKYKLVHPVMFTMFGLESTEDMTGSQPGEVYAELCRMLLTLDRLKGFEPPEWPSARG